MRCKMLLFSAAISSFSAATTKSGNLKHYEILGCLLKRATQLHQRWPPLRLVVTALRVSLRECVRSSEVSSVKKNLKKEALVGWQSRCSTTAVYDRHVILNFIAIITCTTGVRFWATCHILKRVLRSSSTSNNNF